MLKLYLRPVIVAVLALICVVFVQAVESSSVKSTDYYTAGVVEFRPSLTSGLTSNEQVAENLAAYLEIINSDEANETDIIVFPEGTLNNVLQLSYVPNPDDMVDPCLANGDGRYADFLVALSCSARNVSKYIVVNLSEKEDCLSAALDPRPCSSTGYNVFNTNVVFDREGRVISRYRKVHLYGEAKNTTYIPEYGYFDTDFGVRFGHFVCFDIFFYTPAEELVERYGLHDIIFTSMFYSELPFLTAVQLQQSWAWGNNVNLLAAGASNPLYGMTGSGIYAGNKGELVATMAINTGVRKLLVAQVPKWSVRNEGMSKQPTTTNTTTTKITTEDTESTTETTSPVLEGDIKLLQDPEIENFHSQLLPTSSIILPFSTWLCHDDLCCKFSVMTAATIFPSPNTTFYRYRIGIFDGQRTYVGQTAVTNLQICAVFACLDETVASCGRLLNGSTPVQPSFDFVQISILGKFVQREKMLIMPNTLTNSLYSLNGDDIGWQLSKDDTSMVARMNLTDRRNDLLTFGIYVNYYDRSGSPTLLTARLLVLMLPALLVLGFR